MPIWDGQIKVDSSGFNKNLAVSDDTLPKVLTKVDQMQAGSGSTGGGTAESTTVVATGFTKNLSAADVNVQHALETLDKLEVGATGSVGGGASEAVVYGMLGVGGNASYECYDGGVGPGSELFFGTLGQDCKESPMYQSNLFNTSEVIIGRWLDGSILYRKVVDFGALPNNTTKTVAHNISNLARVVNLYGMAYATASGWIPINYITPAGLQYAVATSITAAGNVSITTGEDKSTYTDTKVIIEYTCSDR